VSATVYHCIGSRNQVERLGALVAGDLQLEALPRSDDGCGGDLAMAGQAAAFIVELYSIDPVRLVAGLRGAGVEVPVVVLCKSPDRAELRLRFANHGVSTRDVSLVSHTDPDALANHLRDCISRHRRRRAADATLMQEADHLASGSGLALDRPSYFDDVLDNAPVGVLLLGDDGRIRSINRYGADLFEAAEADLNGAAFKDLFPPDQWEALEATRGTASSPGELPTEASLILGSGSVRHITVRMVPFDHRHDGRGAMAILQDITAQVEATLAAERASATKSLFLANMSHELRTPLNAIIGFSELLRSEALGIIANERYVQYAADINESGIHLLNLINDILDISRLEAGKFVLDESECSIGAVVEGALRFVHQAAARAGIRLEHEGLAALPNVRADERRLTQIVVNLASNAIKFTPSGGRVTVRGHAGGAGDPISISVADTGIGMAADDIPRALAPFDQIDNRLSRRYEGSGLGLPLTKSLAESHGGTLAIESKPGVGTTVTVSLPAERIVAGPSGAAAVVGAKLAS